LVEPIGEWGGDVLRPHGRRRYRSELFIIREILNYLKNRGGVAKTALLGAVNLNNKNGTKYLDKLVKSGLVKQEGNLYSITAKGELALQAMNIVVALLTSGNGLAETCMKKISRIAGSTSVEHDVSIYSPTGMSYVFTAYLPESKTALIVFDPADLDTTDCIYDYVIGALASIDPIDLSKLIIVVGNKAVAHRLRTALSISGINHDRAVVLSECDETALRTLFSAPVQARL